ncbi:MAG: hypothetical protein JKY23_00325 [Nitrospinaceae bacterium]|nr:hypothetical protein [Nitrospinaceae bacterium]
MPKHKRDDSLFTPKRHGMAYVALLVGRDVAHYIKTFLCTSDHLLMDPYCLEKYSTVDTAYKLGYPPLLKLVWHSNWAGSGNMIVSAARHGHLDVVEYMFKVDSRYEWSMRGAVARAGHLHIAKWLYARGVRFIGGDFDVAAANGHTPFLSWLRVVGCPVGEECTMMALKNRKFDTLKALLWPNYDSMNVRRILEEGLTRQYREFKEYLFLL